MARRDPPAGQFRPALSRLLGHPVLAMLAHVVDPVPDDECAHAADIGRLASPSPPGSSNQRGRPAFATRIHRHDRRADRHDDAVGRRLAWSAAHIWAVWAAARLLPARQPCLAASTPTTSAAYGGGRPHTIRGADRRGRLPSRDTRRGRRRPEGDGWIERVRYIRFAYGARPPAGCRAPRLDLVCPDDAPVHAGGGKRPPAASAPALASVAQHGTCHGVPRSPRGSRLRRHADLRLFQFLNVTPPRYLLLTLATAAAGFALVWAWVLLMPMAFMEPEYDAWQAKKVMLQRCDVGDTLILGDSR